jgi:hypothetical protein
MIHAAAWPLDRRQRDAFAAAVLAALDGCPELGPGVVFRTIRALQRDYWDPPLVAAGPPALRRSKLAAGPAILA